MRAGCPSWPEPTPQTHGGGSVRLNLSADTKLIALRFIILLLFSSRRLRFMFELKLLAVHTSMPKRLFAVLLGKAPRSHRTLPSFSPLHRASILRYLGSVSVLHVHSRACIVPARRGEPADTPRSSISSAEYSRQSVLSPLSGSAVAATAADPKRSLPFPFPSAKLSPFARHGRSGVAGVWRISCYRPPFRHVLF